MSLPYSIRLWCACLACFFAAHLVAGLTVWLLATPAIRFGRGLRARDAAGWIFALRTFPTLAGIGVGAVCGASFIWFEPEFSAEQVGIPCLLAASAAVLITARALWRGLSGALRSFFYKRRCLRFGERTFLPGVAFPVWVITSQSPVLALAGILSPRFLISRSLLEALPEDSVAVAFRHEQAHRSTHDNLKRLIILLAPDLPFTGVFRKLEQEWARVSEWAADDAAVKNCSRQAVALADVLVQVARSGLGPEKPLDLVSTLLLRQADLQMRVERLLGPEEATPPRSVPGYGIGICIFGLLAVAAQPGSLNRFYEIVEQLLR